MHGIIHQELRKFVETRYGADAWKSVVAAAGLRDTIYSALQTYPDEDLLALVKAACDLTKKDADTLLEAFGEFIVPDLLSMYRAMINPQWRTLEFLLHTEDTIHRVVRMRNPGANPPRLRFERKGPRQLLFFYDSPRRMAAVARGLIRGIAAHYGEPVVIRETRKANGASEMTITV